MTVHSNAPVYPVECSGHVTVCLENYMFDYTLYLAARIQRSSVFRLLCGLCVAKLIHMQLLCMMCNC